MSEPKKLLDQVSEALRTKHYAYRTEQTYVDWIKCYIRFHKKRHPKDMGANEIREFIAYLATERKVATSTQNQALSAILFLYRTVLEIEIILPPGLVNPSRPKRLPTVLTHTEAMSVISHMRGTPRLMAKLLYGSGLRLMECMRLRVKDIDFENHPIRQAWGSAKGEQNYDGARSTRCMNPDNLPILLLGFCRCACAPSRSGRVASPLLTVLGCASFFIRPLA